MKTRPLVLVALFAVACGGGGVTKKDPPSEDVPARGPSGFELINTALEGGVIDYPTSLLYRGYALVGDERLPEEFRGEWTEEDPAFYREATRRALPQTTKDALAPFLVRPTDPTSIYNTLDPVDPNGLSAQAAVPCTASDPSQDVINGYKTARAASPLRIWVKCTSNAANDDIILANAVAIATDFWPRMIADFGSPVLDDTTVGTAGNLDDAIDLYVVPDGTASLRSGAQQSGRGVTFDVAPFVANTSSAYVLISRSRAADTDGFKSTMIHEFFHVIQDSFNMSFVFEDAANDRPGIEFWWVEASAVWASTHYGRDVARAVYDERFADFQSSVRSLHSSLSTSRYTMYAGFIWGYFEEHKTGGVGIIRQSWEALQLVDTHAEADQELEQVFDYEKDFPEFALANLNEDFPGALAIEKRHKGLDNQFPEPAPAPKYAARDAINAVMNASYTVDIAPLRAGYYRFDITENIKKVIVHFDDVSIAPKLDIRAIEGHKDGSNENADYTGQDKKIYCLDRPGEDVDRLIFSLSNLNTDFTTFINGNIRIEAFEQPCKASWSGTLERTLVQDSPPATATTHWTATVTLEQDDDSPLTLFRPTGSFKLTKFGTIGECELQVPDVNGSIAPSPATGILILFDGSEPVHYQAALATGNYQLNQHVACPPPELSYDMNLQADDALLTITQQEPYVVSEDGKHIDGTKNVTSQYVSDLYEWHLTRDD